VRSDLSRRPFIRNTTQRVIRNTTQRAVLKSNRQEPTYVQYLSKRQALGSRVSCLAVLFREHAMKNTNVVVGSRQVGPDQPVYIIAEIGINHNGSLDTAKRLIDAAKAAGADAVKFQKRTPELCVPRDQWLIERDTPWGRMSYIDYRQRMEFGFDDYAEIDRYCKALRIDWTASCWDEVALEFLAIFDPPFYKLASASLTDRSLLEKLRKQPQPVMLSTGMSTMEEISSAVSLLGDEEGSKPDLMLAHTTSTYPCPLEQLNLRMLATLRSTYPQAVIGYSGHETGLAPSMAAVAMGACFVERHITLDRAMWGTDQAASVEPDGLRRLVNYIRDIEIARGDGVKCIYDTELSARRKLRRADGPRVLALSAVG
jgi:N-acetylneuraminate synthase